MKTKNLRSKIKGIGIVFSLVLGFVLLTSANVQAQYGDRNNQQDRRDHGRDRQNQNDERYDNNQSNMYRTAVQRGYADGAREGLQDSRKRHHGNIEENRFYKNSNNGFNSRYGSRSAYQTAYREGFSRGYNESINRDNNRDNNRNRRGN